MNSLTDDALIYLIELIIENNEFFCLASFLVCNKIKFISDKVVHYKLKTHYKILVRNNNFLTPLHTYNNIYKIYGNKFVVCRHKLDDLLILAAKSNNLELIKILVKTMPKTIKSSEDKSIKDEEIQFILSKA